MRRVVAVVVALLIVWQQGRDVLVAAVQQAPAVPAQTPASPSTPQSSSASDVSIEKLGISFDRIRAELGAARPADDKAEPLKIDYYVEVLGLAPPIRLFTAEELRDPSPIPGAQPTHQELLRGLWTKPEFRAQSVPIFSLGLLAAVKLVQWQTEEFKKRKAEAERKKRDEELRKKHPDLLAQPTPTVPASPIFVK